MRGRCGRRPRGCRGRGRWGRVGVELDQWEVAGVDRRKNRKGQRILGDIVRNRGRIGRQDHGKVGFGGVAGGVLPIGRWEGLLVRDDLRRNGPPRDRLAAVQFLPLLNFVGEVFFD
jgi:hypothetical protein